MQTAEYNGQWDVAHCREAQGVTPVAPFITIGQIKHEVQSELADFVTNDLNNCLQLGYTWPKHPLPFMGPESSLSMHMILY
jgi:hypothetical protein